MIIIRLMGGLGNQLQQYALYRKFIAMNVPAKLDLSWFDPEVQEDILAKRTVEIDRFEGVEYASCTEEEKRALIGLDSIVDKLKHKLFPGSKKIYTENVIYDPRILTYKDKYLEGYFACEKYYSDIMEELRKELTLPPKDNLSLISSQIKESNSVSIHIRRGDYLDSVNKKMFGGICTDEYYDSAVKYVMEHVSTLGKPKFYIFSDDNEYASEYASRLTRNYLVEATTVNLNWGTDSCYDIYLMSLCNHNICANSTFSFWGARLNDNSDKVMIRPTVQKNSQVFDHDSMKELWQGWTFISPLGKIYE